MLPTLPAPSTCLIIPILGFLPHMGKQNLGIFASGAVEDSAFS